MDNIKGVNPPLNSSGLLSAIRSLANKAMIAGVVPDTVWLGPREVEQFREELYLMWSGVGSVPIVNVQQADGVMRFAGLVVRFTIADGLSVAKAFSR